MESQCENGQDGYTLTKKEYQVLKEYLQSHVNDITAGMNDFDDLRPLLLFLERQKLKELVLTGYLFLRKDKRWVEVVTAPMEKQPITSNMCPRLPREPGGMSIAELIRPTVECTQECHRCAIAPEVTQLIKEL